MPVQQLSLLPWVPPAPTIQVRLPSGACTEGVIGPRASSPITGSSAWRARNCGWQPDPHGSWFCVEWVEPQSADQVEMFLRWGLTPRPVPCGLYVQESMLQALLVAGEPFDPRADPRGRKQQTLSSQEEADEEDE